MDSGLSAVVYSLLLLGACGLACATLGHICCQARITSERRRVRARRSSFLPPISILKPLKGVDDDMLGNLESLVVQDYPAFEIVIAIDDHRDPALGCARELQRRHPGRAIRIVVRRNRVGRNPKVNNLLSAIQVARHEYILISDSNVAVDRDYLRATVSQFDDPAVGLVSNLIAGSGERSLGATFENLHLGSFIASNVSAGAAFEHPIVVGKSMLLRRSDLERVGGFASVCDVLAEDYVLGRAFHEAGMRVVLSGHTIRSINRDWSLRQFIARHLRWAQLRRFCHFGAFALEPILYPVPWLLAAGLLQLAGGGSASLVKAAFAGICIKVLSDVVLLWRLRGRPPLLAALTIPLKDCLVLCLWPIALLRRTVVWRGTLLRLGPGTRLIGDTSDDASALGAMAARSGDLV